MPSRNINLTSHYDEYVTQALASGRYKNASEVVRAGLRLLETQEAEDAAKLEALRAAVQEGEEDYKQGRYRTLASPNDIDAYFDELDAELDQRS